MHFADSIQRQVALIHLELQVLENTARQVADYAALNGADSLRTLTIVDALLAAARERQTEISIQSLPQPTS